MSAADRAWLPDVAPVIAGACVFAGAGGSSGQTLALVQGR